MGEIDGLPLHVLVVHVTVVLVPTAALAVLLVAAWPAARVRLGPLPLALALGALAVVPVTTSAGNWLRDRVGESAPVRRHAELGEGLLPWVVALAVVAAAVWWLGSRLDTGLLRVLAAVLALVVAAGTVVTVYRAGESGARSVWEGRVPS
ncbi:MAG: hypothetical protein EPN99_05070 [Frankiales bacterium]|nr:MAG: hypothetical protein EPN99_05070 [Frankiales bacterium]